MKCACGAKDCVATVGFDSGCGMLIAEGNPGAAAAGLYLSVADAITLTKQLRAYILKSLDEPSVGITGWDDQVGTHNASN